jgi:hypothetical protein
MTSPETQNPGSKEINNGAEYEMAQARFRRTWRDSLKPRLEAIGYEINEDFIPEWSAEIQQAAPDILASFDDEEIAEDVKSAIVSGVNALAKTNKKVSDTLIGISSRWAKEKESEILTSSPENIKMLSLLAEHGSEQDKAFVANLFHEGIPRQLLEKEWRSVGIDLIIAMQAGEHSERNEWIKQAHTELKQQSPTDASYLLGKLLSHGNENIVELGKNLVKEDLSSLGFDANEFLRIWDINGNKGKFTNAVIERNMERIYELEPTVAKFLFEEFGIMEFERYPKDMLKRQYEKSDDAETPYGIIVMPRIDQGEHAGAFAQNTQAFQELFDQIKDELNMRVLEVESKQDLARMLITLNRKYGDENKISFALAGGHGSLGLITLGEGKHARDFILKKDLKGRGVQRASNFFVEHPTFVLFSCSTGKEGGFAQDLSQEYNASVIATDSDTSLNSIQKTGEAHNPSFDVQYGSGAKTIQYDRGTLIESK